MNNRYTYGYINGWDVENNYIQDQLAIMKVYNEQRKVLDRLQQDIALVDADIVRNGRIDEETIRTWYNEDVDKTVINKTYEEFRNDIMESRRQHYDGLKQDAERKVDRYSANLYYMSEIKGETRKLVNQRRRELELLLEEKRLERSTIAFERSRAGVQYDENRNILNQDQLREFSAREDANWLEIRKIEHALRELDGMSQELEFTQDELDLMRRGLNPQQRRYYDEIDKSSVPSLTPQEPSNQKTYEPTPGPTGNDSFGNNDGPTGNESSENNDGPAGNEGSENNDNDEDKENETKEELDELEERIKKYKELLEQYKKDLQEYNMSLESFYKLQNRFESKELNDYIHFYEEAGFIKDFYRRISATFEKVNQEYISLKELIDARKSKETDFPIEEPVKTETSDLSLEELEQKLKELKGKQAELFRVSAGVFNGQESFEKEFEELLNQIKLVEEEIRKRKETKITETKNYGELEAPIAPEEPKITFEPIKEIDEEDKNFGTYTDAEKIINLLIGRRQDYKFGDNAALKFKDVKVFGWKKYKERTILDKPIRLVQFGFSAVAFRIPLKLYSWISYGSKRKRLEALKDRVNKLSPRQLDSLIEFGLSNLKKFSPPEVVWTALLPRLEERLNTRLFANNNLLAKKKTEILDLYNKGLQLKGDLNNPNLTPEERKSKQTEFKSISDKLLPLVLDSIKLYNETDELVNPAKLGQRFSISKNLRTGGFWAKNQLNHSVNEIDAVFGDRLERAVSTGDGFAAAEAYISRDKLYKENTVIKKTIRNKGGETSVGSRFFNPFIEIEDFEKNPYLSNLLQTATLAMTVCHLFKQIGLQNELDKYRDIINKQNTLIRNYQAQYALLEKDAFAILDPAAQQSIVDALRTQGLNQAGCIQGLCEDFAQKAQAGVMGAGSPVINSNASVYGPLDRLAHSTTAGFVNDLNSISRSLSPEMQLAEIEKIMENMHTFMSDFTAKSITDVSKYMASKAGVNFTASQAFAQTINSVNPTLAITLQDRLLNLAEGIINLPTLNTVQQLTANADIAGAIAVLTGVLGQDVVDSEFTKMLKEGKLHSAAELASEYSEKLDSIQTPEEKTARQIYNKKLEEWDLSGKKYRRKNRKNEPNYTETYNELIEEEIDSVYERGL